MTSDFEGFSIPDFINYIYFPILILEKEPVFPFSMFSSKQGNYWYYFITSLVWRGPWLWIEPGTSRNRYQHYTTRLSRWRLLLIKSVTSVLPKCLHYLLVLRNIELFKWSCNEFTIILSLIIKCLTFELVSLVFWEAGIWNCYYKCLKNL